MSSSAAYDKEHFIVESIVDHVGDKRKKSTTLFFRVHWSGYEDSEDSWLPWSHVNELAALDVYLAAHKELGLK